MKYAIVINKFEKNGTLNPYVFQETETKRRAVEILRTMGEPWGNRGKARKLPGVFETSLGMAYIMPKSDVAGYLLAC